MSNDPTKRLNEIQERNQKIILHSTQINTKIESAHENLKRLKKNLEEKFGTSDIEELKKLLSQWEEEDEKALLEAEKILDEKEKEISEKSQKIKSIQQNS